MSERDEQAVTRVEHHKGYGKATPLYPESVIAALRAQVEEKERALICDVCLGQPLPSGKQCVCNGFGTIHSTLTGVRQMLFDMTQRATAAEAALARPAVDEKSVTKAFSDWAWMKDGHAVGVLEGADAAREAWFAAAKLYARPAEDGLAERLELFATAIQITDGPTDEYELVSKAASALRWQARLGDCPEDWRTGAFDIYKELPDDEHAPWYVKCPSGQLIKLGGHASDHEDKKQAYFIAMACNAALGRQA